MPKGLLSFAIVLFAALVLVAPQARAEFMPRDYGAMHSEDVDKTMMVLKHLKHHPHMVKELSAELTMHLLDLQIAKLSHLAHKPYGRKPEHKPIKLYSKDWGIEKIDSFRFHSARSCQLNQSKVARQNAWKRNIFVGPCQSGYGEGYAFNVWNVNR